MADETPKIRVKGKFCDSESGSDECLQIWNNQCNKELFSSLQFHPMVVSKIPSRTVAKVSPQSTLDCSISLYDWFSCKKGFITLLNRFKVMNYKQLLKIIATIGFWRDVQYSRCPVGITVILSFALPSNLAQAIVTDRRKKLNWVQV